MTRTYLVECYGTGLERAEVESATERAHAASTELRKDGQEVEYVGAILVPEDEVVFHVFAAEAAAAVHEANARASVAYERIVESVAMGGLELRRKNLWAARCSRCWPQSVRLRRPGQAAWWNTPSPGPRLRGHSR